MADHLCANRQIRCSSQPLSLIPLVLGTLKGLAETHKLWNWLPDEFGANPGAKLCHWTLGTPCFHEYAHVPMASKWHREKLLAGFCLQRVIDGPFDN